MTHFKVEQKSLSDLQTAYPNTPTNHALSTQDYLEDMLSQGYDFAGVSDHANGAFFVFRVVAK